MRRVLLALGVALTLAQGVARADEAGLTALLAGGHVAMVRHGLTTPGSGDPRGFKLDDCATQRNLIEEGREESRRLGRLLREHGVKVDRVLSSQWCRCLETARLMDVGEVEIFPALNNLYGRPENRAAQVRELRELVEGWEGPGNLLLVTHGSVLGAFIRVNPRTAQGVVLKPAPGTEAGFALVGRIGPEG